MSPDAVVTSMTFDEILESCRQFLLGIANSELPAELRAKGGASDLVQETMAAAHRCREQFRGRSLSELRSWLRGILLNELAMFRRRFMETAARDVAREVPLELVQLCSSTRQTNHSDHLVRQEELSFISEAVQRLPDASREVIRLHFENGFGYSAIGERMGRSSEAVRKLLSRAIKELQHELAGLRQKSESK